MSDYTLEFNRIAERLVFQSMKQHLINKISFPSGSIYLQAPSDQYVNTRTETINKEEALRYPSISIYTIMEEEDSVFQSFHSETVTETTGTVRQYESDMMINATVELCLETTTTRDYMIWKNRVFTFLSESRNGLRILNDVLPTFAGFSVLLKNVKEFIDKDIRSSVYTLKLQYRIYKEYVAYMFREYELQLTLGEDILNSDNAVSETFTQDGKIVFIDSTYPISQINNIVLRVSNEIPNGLINGANTVFSTQYIFKLNTTEVFYNGQKMTLNLDYIESSNQEITFLFVPDADANINIDYIRIW